jgi:hypothetical protein
MRVAPRAGDDAAGKLTHCHRKRKVRGALATTASAVCRSDGCRTSRQNQRAPVWTGPPTSGGNGLPAGGRVGKYRVDANDSAVLDIEFANGACGAEVQGILDAGSVSDATQRGGAATKSGNEFPPVKVAKDAKSGRRGTVTEAVRLWMPDPQGLTTLATSTPLRPLRVPGHSFSDGWPLA